MSRLQWLVCISSLASLASCTVNFTTVFTHGEGGWPCIRIPSITLCGGTLHAFAECRNRTGDGCIPTTKSHTTADKLASVTAGICYKSSSDDGATWSEIKQVVPGATQPTVACNTDSHLLLQYNVGTENKAVLSIDNGATWGPPYTVHLGGNDWAYVGPGRGLVLTSEKSPNPGRILLIGHHGAYEYDLVWYSDDAGQTYTVSETVLPKMDEAQLVELSDGRIMANMRNKHLNSCDCRAVAISSDGGKTFGNTTYDPTLISPVIYSYQSFTILC
jgi:sialidase-1